jgi:cobalt-zinc-cadmium efflux system membrane fusion protein
MSHSPPQASGSRTPRLPPTRQMLLLGVLAGLAVVILFGPPLIGRLFAPKPPPPEAPAPEGTFRPTPEQMAALKIVTVQSTGFRPGIETEGKIATDDDRTTSVYSPYSGRVTRVLASIGDHVRAGQPLFAIEASEFVQAQTDLAAAVAQLKIAEAAEARQAALFKINGTAQKDLLQSQADLVNAQTTLSAVHGRLRILGQSEAQIAALEKRPLGQPVRAESLVTSPIDGVVTQRAIGPGQNLGSVTNGGSTAAFQVSDLSTVWLVGQLREVDAPLARVGQDIAVRVEALPGQIFAAKLAYVAPTVDPVSRRVAVRATIANPGGVLKPEMFARFSLQTGRETTAVAAPADAVIYEADTARVWVARPGGLLELRPIKTGQAEDGMVAVTSGLAAGDRVVVGGALFIDRAAKSD